MELRLRALLYYGLLAAPLAMAALPVYVLAPSFYGDTLGLPLGVLGFALLAARLVDTIQDPLLGYWSDRMRNGRVRFSALGVPLLAVGFVALFMPPQLGTSALVAWLIGSLLLAYTGYSMSSIGYLAWGAELGRSHRDRMRVTATREAFSLAGVLLGALLPQALMRMFDVPVAMAWFTAAFTLILFVTAGITLARAPRPAQNHPPDGSALQSWRHALSNRGFLRLCTIFLINGMAAAVPATLVIFYVEYILDAAAWTGVFLALYFLAGVAGMPLWVRLAERRGKDHAWLLAMGLAIVAFAWAALLGSGDLAAFALICIATGLALGADLALPPAMLADVLAARPKGFDEAGSHFGLWNLLTKLSLALAAGTALPLLQWLGFRPGDAATGLGALAITYALVPCGLKLAAAIALIRWQVPRPKEVAA